MASIAGTHQCHVADATLREVVVVGPISARRAGKHDEVAAGKVGIHDRRYALGATVMLHTHTHHSLTNVERYTALQLKLDKLSTHDNDFLLMNYYLLRLSPRNSHSRSTVQAISAVSLLCTQHTSHFRLVR